MLTFLAAFLAFPAPVWAFRSQSPREASGLEALQTSLASVPASAWAGLEVFTFKRVLSGGLARQIVIHFLYPALAESMALPQWDSAALSRLQVVRLSIGIEADAGQPRGLTYSVAQLDSFGEKSVRGAVDKLLDEMGIYESGSWNLKISVPPPDFLALTILTVNIELSRSAGLETVSIENKSMASQEQQNALSANAPELFWLPARPLLEH